MNDRVPIVTLLVVCLWLFPDVVRAQYVEAGTYMGFSNYKGELNGQRILFRQSGPAMGLYSRFNYSRHLAAKASLTYGRIQGTDAVAADPQLRLRNLNFRSDILELAITGEINLVPFAIREHKTASPYLFGGLSLFHFNPEGEFKGQWYALRELGTEGQMMYGQPYSLWQLAVPFGFGFKFNISYQVNFGFEVGFRKTFTDYLDDVSGTYPDFMELWEYDEMAAMLSYRTPELTGTYDENPSGKLRGDPTTNDMYLFMGMTLSVNLTDRYGLDFDPRYEQFKRKYNDESLLRRQKIKEHQRKRRQALKERRKRLKRIAAERRKSQKKRELEPPVKKRTK